eukprot:m.163995 g.163995  ORF g.163995 m.163995 type:complete len:156 (-) comp13419_c0_seq1:1129-1596(-)
MIYCALFPFFISTLRWSCLYIIPLGWYSAIRMYFQVQSVVLPSVIVSVVAIFINIGFNSVKSVLLPIHPRIHRLQMRTTFYSWHWELERPGVYWQSSCKYSDDVCTAVVVSPLHCMVERVSQENVAWLALEGDHMEAFQSVLQNGCVMRSCSYCR